MKAKKKNKNVKTKAKKRPKDLFDEVNDILISAGFKRID